MNKNEFAYLSMGTNMGDRIANLSAAIAVIKDTGNTIVKRVSSVYKTSPVGYIDQDDFANICICVETSLKPSELLALCNEIEETLGRKRVIRWGPRIIDVDILLYEGYSSNDERLTIPHKLMWERAFVLVPLKEIGDELSEKYKAMLEESFKLLSSSDISSTTVIGKLDV